MPFEPIDFSSLSISDNKSIKTPSFGDDSWIPILQHGCDFDSLIFENVSINLIRNPNINSSHLFRADILYDSLNDEYTNTTWPAEDLKRLLQTYAIQNGEFPGFHVKRTLIRQMIPRNPQLDRPIAQTCHILRSTDTHGVGQTLVIYVPHVSQLEDLPWYHPTVQSLAFLHTWQLHPPSHSSTHPSPPNQRGTISIHFQLFPSQTLPLPPRVLRTAHHLLSTLHKHGQGSLAGYSKRVHHDQLISQQRVQDTYSHLKTQHAKRLCDAWVEQTEPSKHVFEDLGIAAFLLELWKDMYQIPLTSTLPPTHPPTTSSPLLPPFPGFIDIGCGNGVLVEILLLSGYPGRGFDARRRKTWSILSPHTRNSLHEQLLIPQPLLDLDPSIAPSLKRANLLHRALHPLVPKPPTPHHTGLFPRGTFIISNHADELTPWTPLLASLSRSPFLAIPCCSHNLSGARFRAPSAFNALTADAAAPRFFAGNVSRAKSVMITVPVDDRAGEVERGDLKALRAERGGRMPSAYASLCEWVESLAREVGFRVVQREMLRIPSTRNVGIVGRGVVDGGVDGEEERWRVVRGIVEREGVDPRGWVERGGRLREGRGNGLGKSGIH